MSTSHRQKEDSIPIQNLNISAREIHALLQYMDFTFEQKGIDEFFKGFTREDDQWWDEEATRSIYDKLIQRSAYFYQEGYLSMWDD